MYAVTDSGPSKLNFEMPEIVKDLFPIIEIVSDP